ncbi:MAG: CAP domain-containing protein [Cyclobacteriaceae bacterium]
MSPDEEKLFNLINDYRESEGLEPIPFSAALTTVAQAHVRDLENEYDYSPDNECNPHSWSSKGEWTSCCYTNDHKARECMWNKPREIAGYTDSGYEIAFYASAGATADVGLQHWLKSTGHKPLIINGGQWGTLKWNAMGIGIYGRYAVVWFGASPDPSVIEVCDQ